MRRFPFSCFRSLQYWPVAAVLFIFYLLSFLPLRIFLLLSYCFSALFFLLSKLRHISTVNIQWCFPELSDSERSKLLKMSVKELGFSVAETLYLWFRDGNALVKNRISEVYGLEYWQAALAQPQGIIALSCHSGSLDMNVALLNQMLDKNFHQLQSQEGREFPPQKKEFAFTYRQPSNEFADNFLRTVRKIYADYFFPVSNLLGISRVLKQGGVVWYAPDIETSKKGRVFVKFMGVDAATPSAIGKLAHSTGAVVLPYRHQRENDGSYSVHFYPLLQNFPQGDAECDTQAVNDAIEIMVRANPAAYWWSIKRFRYRPDGGASLYKK